MNIPGTVAGRRQHATWQTRQGRGMRPVVRPEKSDNYVHPKLSSADVAAARYVISNAFGRTAASERTWQGMLKPLPIPSSPHHHHHR